MWFWSSFDAQTLTFSRRSPFHLPELPSSTLFLAASIRFFDFSKDITWLRHKKHIKHSKKFVFLFLFIFLNSIFLLLLLFGIMKYFNLPMFWELFLILIEVDSAFYLRSCAWKRWKNGINILVFVGQQKEANTKGWVEKVIKNESYLDSRTSLAGCCGSSLNAQ